MTRVILFLSLFLLAFASCDSEEKQFENELGDIANYIEDNNLDAQSTPSGLHYVELQQGIGNTSPTLYDNVTVDYVGEYLDGLVFEANQNVSFSLGGVILGWQEGLQLMVVGDTYLFIIPSRLAYGESGRGSIPADTPLVFEVTLKNF
ncbi:MAG: peptidylprolyl isomerase [Saprospiraceae bacterium]|nr:peptidylprolyl isomerase [Saprospiraceae bacterium]